MTRKFDARDYTAQAMIQRGIRRRVDADMEMARSFTDASVAVGDLTAALVLLGPTTLPAEGKTLPVVDPRSVEAQAASVEVDLIAFGSRKRMRR